MTPSTEPKLLIDLTNARQATALDASSILHRMQIEDFLNRVNEVVGRVDSFKEKLNQCGDGHIRSVSYERYHDVITLHGKRGSGKTTFLLSALKLLQGGDDSHKAFRDNGRNNLKKLCVLEILDPTLFGLHEHLLLSLLSKIAFEVRSAAKKGIISSCEGQGAHCCLEKWEKSLRRFAKSLKHMGETRDDLESSAPKEIVQWEDAEFIFEHNMDNAQSSFGLEREFHNFLNESLKLLEKNAFVLTLDDIDTRPQIGWHVLEVLRRYFTSPQLVVVLSGDMDLFKTIIEKQQLKIFDLNFSSKAEVRKEFKSRVDGLTEQYLLKILRTPSRISLGSFQSAINQWKLRCPNGGIEIGKNGGILEMNRLLEYSLFPLLACGKREERIYREAFFANPARTATQAVDALWEAVRSCSSMCSSDDTTPKLVQLDPSDFGIILERFREIFFVSLQNLGFDRPQDIGVVLNDAQGVNLILEKLFERGYIASGIDLLPTRKNTDENNALIALCAEVTQAMYANPAVLMAYFFKACLLREVLVLQSVALENSNFYNMWNFLGVDSQVFPTHLAARISVLHLGDPVTAPVRNSGELQLYSETFSKNTPMAMVAMYGTKDGSGKVPDELEKFRDIANGMDSSFEGRKLKVWINSPESLATAIKSWQQILSGAGIVDIKRQGATYRYFSIFSFIAILNDIVECEDDMLAYSLYNFGQIVSSSAYKQAGAASVDVSDADEPVKSDDVDPVASLDSEQYLRVMHSINEWKNDFRKKILKIKSPVKLSARVMERFFASLKSIDAAYSNGEMFLGKYIHRCLVAFFNSVLVEEFQIGSSESSGSSKVIVKNAVTDDKVFLSHLNKAEVIDQKEMVVNKDFPFLSIVLSFPLWAEYLDPDGAEHDFTSLGKINIWKLVKSLSGFKDDNSCFEVEYVGTDRKFVNLYPLLNSMARIKKKKEK